MRRHRVAFLLLLTILAGPTLAAKKKVSPVPAAIEQARAAVLAGKADAVRDLQPLLDLLVTADDSWDVRNLARAIEELGSYEQWSPAWVKEYFRTNAPRQVIARLRRDPPVEEMGGAVLMLRSLNVDDAAIDQVVAATLAFKGDNPRAEQFEGRLLSDWRAHQPENPVIARDPAKEKAALDFLRTRNQRLNPWSLENAARQADVTLLEPMLNAGMQTPGMTTTLLFVVLASGSREDDAAARLATVELLLGRGAEATYTDANGNTLLMAAVRNEPPVVGRLLEAGAQIDAVNAVGLSALLLAFQSNNWELAELLVERGARSSEQALDKIFFEKPQEPAKQALVLRATAKP